MGSGCWSSEHFAATASRMGRCSSSERTLTQVAPYFKWLVLRTLGGDALVYLVCKLGVWHQVSNASIIAWCSNVNKPCSFMPVQNVMKNTKRLTFRYCV